MRGIENFQRQFICMFIGVVHDLLQELFEEDAREHGDGQQYQPRHDQRKFCAQPELHSGYDSVSVRSLPYSFSLLCNVLRLTPRSSAARVLLFPVADRVCKINSRSIASTVVPIGNLIADKSFGPFAAVFPNSPGKLDRPINSFSDMIAARSSTLRSSRIFPGQV